MACGFREQLDLVALVFLGVVDQAFEDSSCHTTSTVVGSDDHGFDESSWSAISHVTPTTQRQAAEALGRALLNGERMTQGMSSKADRWLGYH